MKKLFTAISLAVLAAASLPAADVKAFDENEFQEKHRRILEEPDESERQRQARDLFQSHRFSSLQVKKIAASLRDDAARLEFATMAYPRTIDPENFYEVYDAFTTFSKMMRLHDRIHQFPPASAPPVVNLPRIVTKDEIATILKSLRRETFDNTRMQVARQILSTSRSQFLSSQIKQVADCFDFEPAKLEVAKYAYQYTFDREKYFVVNETFTFDSNKHALASYIETWNRQNSATTR